MTQKDWTLVVIAAARGRAISPVQLQKSLFLLSRNLSPKALGVEQLYNFEPYDYGPFDNAVYHDAEQLERDGQIVITEAGTRYRKYQATQEGSAFAESLVATLDPKASAYLERVVVWVTTLSFNELVESIYKFYPDMTKNSVYRR